VAAETAAAKEFRSGLVSRQELLADLEQRGEGLEQGVRRILELSQNGLFPGIRGIVASLFNVDVRYAMLIEAALGDGEQSIVINRREDVVAALETLEEALEGRAGFLPLDSLRPAAEPLDVSQFPGVVARAADLVQTEADLRPAVECLLGRTLLVNDLATALQLAAGPLAAMRFVTMAGEVVEPDGRLSLGRLTARAGLISRHSERRTLDTQLVEVQSRITVLAARSEDVLRRIHSLDEEQKELRSVIYDASTARVDLAAQLRRLDDTADAVRAEQPLLNSEIADVDGQTAQLAARRSEFDARLGQLEAESIRRREEVETLGRQLSLSEADRHKIEDRRTQQRVDVATVEEQRRSVVNRLAHLRDTRDDAARQRRDAAEELSRCASRLAEAERTILRHESVIADLFLKKEAAAVRSRELAQARTEGREQVAALAEQVRELADQLHAAEEKFHALDIEARECRLKMESLCQRVRDDFALDLAEKHASYVAQEVDWAAIDAEIEELKGKIERLGAVNLEAIKEQDELERRAAFLKTQQSDLQQAGKMLNDLIARLNQESITRFNATFAQVRENFSELFRKLFGGGKADIVLLNPEDVLESGIEIIARPPGKEPCSISLLSGGEKTLTAVALLMAVFRSKPSPYCILDEVDAALDEANNQRFNSLVQEFVKDSQFIIISHSKRTMSAADVLYGVTMQEPGVSKKISVRFSDVHDLNLNDPAALAAQDRPEQAAGA
jgi:chromosome segregation protein